MWTLFIKFKRASKGIKCIARQFRTRPEAVNALADNRRKVAFYNIYYVNGGE